MAASIADHSAANLSRWFNASRIVFACIATVQGDVQEHLVGGLRFNKGSGSMSTKISSPSENARDTTGVGGEFAELSIHIVPSRNPAVGERFRDRASPEVSESLAGVSGSPPTNRVRDNSKE